MNLTVQQRYNDNNNATYASINTSDFVFLPKKGRNLIIESIILYIKMLWTVHFEKILNCIFLVAQRP